MDPVSYITTAGREQRRVQILALDVRDWQIAKQIPYHLSNGA